MQVIDKYLDMKLAQRVAYSLAGSFLLFHVGLFIFFWHYGVTPMMYFNIFSVAYYAFSFYLIRRELLMANVIATYIEVMLHMVLAVWCVGWDYGFQVTLIGMTLMGFFSEYIARSVNLWHIPAVPLAFISMAAYVIAFVITITFPPQYAENLASIKYALQIFWGIATFSMMIGFMHAFTMIAYQSEESLSTVAVHDELTGMPNRHYMSGYLANVAEEEGLESYWLAMADIDDFKTINDTYGHVFGDQVLKTVGEALSESGAGESCCRWGGEEFLMVGKGDDMALVKEKLDRLRNTVNSHSIWYGDERIRVSVTIGVAAYQPGESRIEWVNRADANLYAGKRNGKNQVVCDQAELVA